MQTVYFLVFTLLGGVLAVFASAGWSSYTDHKLPDLHALFRWLLAGTLTSGLASYAWLFGAGGDPSAMLASVSDALNVKEVVNTLSTAVHSSAEVVEPVEANTAPELTLGMPKF